MHNIKTKIVATVGPATSNKSMISKLIDSGVNVMRINMSHFSTINSFETIVSIIRNESSAQNKHVGILMDLAGPKIRLDLRLLDGKSIQI